MSASRSHLSLVCLSAAAWHSISPPTTPGTVPCQFRLALSTDVIHRLLAVSKKGPCLYYFSIPMLPTAHSEPSSENTQCKKPWWMDGRSSAASMTLYIPCSPLILPYVLVRLKFRVHTVNLSLCRKYAAAIGQHINHHLWSVRVLNKHELKIRPTT